MSRQEAFEQYNYALKLGQKYYKSAVISGGYPYLQALDEVLDESMVVGRAEIGLVNIPSEQIVGVKSVGRRSALAGNFMPLLDTDSEFATKWIALCEAHLSDEGIRDPIKCCEYMGRFYVQEGNKRVSVLKSYHAPTIPGIVTRIVPEFSDDPAVQIYYEFMNFYRLAGLYQLNFSHSGSFAKLQAALGFAPKHVWTDEERRSFLSGYYYFKSAFDKLNVNKLAVTAADALLVWLQVFSFSDIKNQGPQELQKNLSTVWPDIEIMAQGQPISVSVCPKGQSRKLISKLFSVHPGRLNAAFIYGFDPARSAWTRAHEHGREYLEKHMADRVDTHVYYANGRNYAEAMEQAVSDGADIIFATTPLMIGACRRIAALHSGLRVMNCSLSLPYTGVRSYYSRIYECKFITGAIAGAMAEQNTIGFVANYPIYGVPAGINAFALGAKLTNPRAKIKLVWSCTKGDPLKELTDQGISVISNKEATNPENEHWAMEWGTYKLQPDGSMLPLAVPCWNWGPFYEKVMLCIMSGEYDSKAPGQAINYWWGMNSGVIDVQLSDSIPDGVRSLAEILKKGITNGTIDPFKCRLVDQNGLVRSDGGRDLTPEEIMFMDWLCDNVEGTIPAFDQLLPSSQEMVRLLGVYRDKIPPETEEEKR